MQAVLLDALSELRIAAAGAFAAKPPAHLVKRDVEPLLPIREAGQLPGGPDRPRAPAQDGHLLLGLHHALPCCAARPPAHPPL